MTISLLVRKLGGNDRTFDQLKVSRDTVELCGFNDFRFLGYPYTWSNGREGLANIQCRFDRAMATKSFCNRCAPIRVTHLSKYGSDDSVVRINLEDHDHLK